MPRGDGTGPVGGAGAGTGRGAGMGSNQGQGRTGGFNLGAGGQCVCPSCGKKVPHKLGTPCTEQKCPNCGVGMTRER